MPASIYSSYLSYVAETTAGESPSSPSMNKLRTTDPQGIQAGKDSFQSEEVISHRQRENIRAGRKNVDGSIPIELSYGAFDDWLEAVLGGSWSSEAAGTPNVLKVGNSVQTFTVEKGFDDITQYQVLRGVTPTSFSVDAPPDGIVTGGFDVIGMGFDPMSGTSLGSPAGVATNAPFDGICNASITEGGAAIAIVTSLSFQIANGRTISGVIGSCDGSAPTNGQVEVTGEFSARLEDATLIDKFVNESESSLMVQFDDLGGTEYTKFTMPRLRYSDVSTGENDNSVDVTMSFEALYDSTEASSLVIERSNAA